MICEIFGAPGVGKSALCNDLWPPSVEWDGLPPPDDWAPFIDYAHSIVMHTGEDHWRRMFDKAVRKMATLQRSGAAYAGVGLVMRGLDLCWRQPRLGLVAGYFRLMPLPAGAISLYADLATIEARNRERAKAQPSRELSKLAHLNEAPRRLVMSLLKDRGVPLLELDTRQPITDNVARIRSFVGLPATAADATAA
jgi:hypothetical protein